MSRLMKNERAALLLVAMLTLSAATAMSVQRCPDSSRMLTQRVLTERAVVLLDYLGVDAEEYQSRLLAFEPAGKVRPGRRDDSRITPLDCAPGAASMRDRCAPLCLAVCGTLADRPVTPQRRFDMRRSQLPPPAMA